MRQDAAYFRDRAKHCRELAKTASDRSTIKYLLQMAEDFEEEARRLSAPKGKAAGGIAERFRRLVAATAEVG